MKAVKVSKKQAALLTVAQNKAQQLSVLAQEAQAQVRALVEIIADIAGVDAADVVSVDAAAETVTVLEPQDKPQPQTPGALPELPHEIVGIYDEHPSVVE
jgi:hypothetical protein